MEWYYALNGQQQSPVSEEELHSLFQQGVIKPEALVWKQSMGNWQPYGQVFGIAASPSAFTGETVGPMGTAGQTHNRDLRKQAREALSGNWLPSMGMFFLMGLVLMVSGIIPFSGLIISGPLFLGMNAYFLGVSRGQSVDVGTLFRGFDRFVDSLVLYLLTMLIYLGTMIVLSIPIGTILFLSTSLTGDERNLDQGLAFLGVFMVIMAFSFFAFCMLFSYLQSRIGLAYFYLWENPTMGGSAAISASWNATRSCVWKLFRMHIFFALIFALAYLASLALVTPIGILTGENIAPFVFFPLFMIAMMLVSSYMLVSIGRFYDDLKSA